MQKLTQEMLDNSQDGDILLTWEFIDSGNTNIQNTWNKVKWVLVRWVIWDFAIYHEYIYSNESMAHSNLWEWENTTIAAIGDKLPKAYVKELIDISDELLNKYRE